MFSGTIDLSAFFNYAYQDVPDYIVQDNGDNNPITDEKATIGRVLFYDKQLSADLSTACASCHLQEFAFGDTSLVSQGANGLTGRHSMRLINSRFSEENSFFWDKRASTLEDQTTMPIRDHAEMGFSGTNGDPDFDDLLNRLNDLDYYGQLFEFVYGDQTVTEDRIQECLGQFIRSIQSFDSRYDEGLAQTNDPNVPFPNFTVIENLGKDLFMEASNFDTDANRISGGANCNSCHRAPEFDIDPVSRNNGVVLEVDGSVNFEIHRSPTLRDLFNPTTGQLNGPLMHNGNFQNLGGVIQHYNNLGNNLPTSFIPQLDTRLRVGSNAQKLNLDNQEIMALSSFLRTLTGTDVYTNEKWSDPFDEFGNIEIFDPSLSSIDINPFETSIYPNPSSDYVNIEGKKIHTISIVDLQGKLVVEFKDIEPTGRIIDIRQCKPGIYVINLIHESGVIASKKLIKL